MKNPKAKPARLSSGDSSSLTASHTTLNISDMAARNVLMNKLDGLEDGRVDTKVQSVVGSLIAQEHNSKLFKRGILVMSAFAVVLLLATCGLTKPTVVAVRKDAQGGLGHMLDDEGFTSEKASGARGRRLLEALRYYIYCSTQDCTSWTPEERNMCGGDTGISCTMVAADGDYMFVDDPPPPSPAALAPLAAPPVPTNGAQQNSASVGYSGGCGGTITVTTSSCLAAAELCYSRGNALVSAAPLTTIANNNYKCRQAQCTNGATWGWTTLSSYTFQGGGTATLSFCAGTKLWTFCC